MSLIEPCLQRGAATAPRGRRRAPGAASTTRDEGPARAGGLGRRATTGSGDLHREGRPAATPMSGQPGSRCMSAASYHRSGTEQGRPQLVVIGNLCAPPLIERRPALLAWGPALLLGSSRCRGAIASSNGNPPSARPANGSSRSPESRGRWCYRPTRSNSLGLAGAIQAVVFLPSRASSCQTGRRGGRAQISSARRQAPTGDSRSGEPPARLACLRLEQGRQ